MKEITEAEKKELVKQLDSAWLKIWDILVDNFINQLKEEALVAYPTGNDRQDAYSSGFRHGYFVGLTKLKEEINEMNK